MSHFFKGRRYQQSKLANLLFTYALHEHISQERPKYADKIKSICAHPGTVFFVFLFLSNL